MSWGEFDLARVVVVNPVVVAECPGSIPKGVCPHEAAMAFGVGEYARAADQFPIPRVRGSAVGCGRLVFEGE